MRLRHFTEEDFEFISENWTDNKRMTGIFFPTDKTEYKELIAKWNTCLFNGKYFEQFIIEDGVPVGLCSLYEHSDNEVSYGAILDSNFYRRGYCTFACKELVKIAKQKGFNTMSAGAREDNEASIGFLKKFGFVYKETIINSRGNKQLQFTYSIE